MANNKQNYTESCKTCGKPVKGVFYVNACPETGRKKMHYICENGHLDTERVVEQD